MKIQFFTSFFERTGTATMPRLLISRRGFRQHKRELCTIKSDRHGEKTRSRLSPKALTRRIPSRKHALPSGNHQLDKRKFQISFFPFIFFNDSTSTSISFYLAGDSSKAQSELGWKPQTSFDTMVERMVMNDIHILGEGFDNRVR